MHVFYEDQFISIGLNLHDSLSYSSSTVDLDENQRTISEEIIDHERNYTMVNRELSVINARLNSGAAGGKTSLFALVSLLV